MPNFQNDFTRSSSSNKQSSTGQISDEIILDLTWKQNKVKQDSPKKQVIRESTKKNNNNETGHNLAMFRVYFSQKEN